MLILQWKRPSSVSQSMAAAMQKWLHADARIHQSLALASTASLKPHTSKNACLE